MKLFSMVVKKWRKEWLNGKSESWDLLKSGFYMFLAKEKYKYKKGALLRQKGTFP